ncbi:MAG: YeeE/YedE family protein [Gammaproteobacteria bacterium]|nr:YeeE/YedE family protein [Gammaproteobacteria bacterium]
MDTTTKKPDTSLVLVTGLGLLAVSIFLRYEFAPRQTALFLIGSGLGITLFHASFGFTGGWRQFVRKQRGASIRAQLLLLAGTSLLFFPILGQVFPQINVNGALGPVSVSVLVGAFLFGIGMQLGGGCGSGTLFTVGGGHVRMLITLSFFIIGTVVGTLHLSWWLALPNLGKVSLIDSLGWIPALLLQAVALGVLYRVVAGMERRRHGRLDSLGGDTTDLSPARRLVFGPWPLWWGVAGLCVLSLLTLLVAGHPWSITFAFGLWGAKIWSALGGDISAWSYWNSGYPAAALQRSVLADTTSLMDIGIVLGAVLAAGLAGRFAPPSKLKFNAVVTAILGGLLLGYGARLAFGCNIGGMLAGIASGSVHGWLWLVAGFLGSVTGVRLRILFRMDSPFEAGQ